MRNTTNHSVPLWDHESRRTLGVQMSFGREHSARNSYLMTRLMLRDFRVYGGGKNVRNKRQLQHRPHEALCPEI